ncbi:dihydrofolate reductase [Nematocida displodere]|uniref:Dihydrofolate reductase n=1 Tax=Nematocida displodere TaxID=1805483 RepID=A0A177EB84_9MICR|nr:dihydrofolate reductase [Nematocida displodere]
MVPILLAAVSLPNGVIGRNNTLPWPKLSADFGFMNYLTTRKPSALIMGRKTFESIGRVLPRRTSLVLSSKAAPSIQTSSGSAHFLSSLAEAFSYCSEHALQPVIFGGETLYNEVLKTVACTVYLTAITNEHEGDTYFPLSLLRAPLANISEEVLGLLPSVSEKVALTKDGYVVENEIKYGFFKSKHYPAEGLGVPLSELLL